MVKLHNLSLPLLGGGRIFGCVHFFCRDVVDSGGKAAEEDVVGTGDGVGGKVAGKSGIVKLRLKGIIMVVHGALDGMRGVVG